MGFTRINRCMAMICLAGSCQMIRTLPDAVPLDFSCQAQIEAPTLYANNQPQTKITITLTPNNEGTQASSLTLTEWSLPEGMNGLLLDSEGKAVTGDTPLAWGEHVWHYSPVGIGEHLITLHLSEPYEEEPQLIELSPIQVLEDLESEVDAAASVVVQPVPFAVSAWMRACAGEEHTQVHGGDKEVVALEIRIGDIPATLQDASFKLGRWQLPEGVRGMLENTAGERLEAFPLSTEAGTFFLSLEKGHQVQEREEPLRLWVEVPGGITQEKEVPLHWRQTSFPFDLTLTATPIQLFGHEQTPVALTIIAKDAQLQNTYTLDALTLSHGQLQGTGSGVVLAPGAALSAGEHQFTFSWPNNNIAAETRVNIRLTVSNKQGDSRTLEQVLTVRPVNFSFSTWMRPLTEEEAGQAGSGDKDVVALDLRLEDIPQALETASFKLQQWQLPRGVWGLLYNADQERRHTFPLRTDAKNTLFLAFDKGSNYRAARHPLRLRVQGPGGVMRQQDVGLDLVRGKALERLMGDLRRLGLRTGDKNPADYLVSEDPTQLGVGVQLARDYIRNIRQVMNEAGAYGAVDDLPGAMAGHYKALVARKEALERVQERLEEKRHAWQDIARLGGIEKTIVHFAGGHATISTQRDKVCFLTAIRKHGVNNKIRGFELDYTALYCAVWHSDLAIFNLLLAEGADVNIPDSRGETPLMKAAAVESIDNFSMVRELLARGADVFAQMTGKRNIPANPGYHWECVRGWTALHAAVASRSRDMVYILLNHARYHTTEGAAELKNRCARFINTGGGLNSRSASEYARCLYDAHTTDYNVFRRIERAIDSF